MSVFVNLTPHSIEVYPESAFADLEQLNPTTWVADGVDKLQAIASFPSVGMARISTKTEEVGPLLGIPMVATTYGEATGIPNDLHLNSRLIVSLPMQSMAKASEHPMADQMVAPYRVVRSRSDGSVVLGCMGFTY